MKMHMHSMHALSIIYLSVCTIDKDVEKPKKSEMGSAVLDNKGMHIIICICT